MRRLIIFRLRRFPCGHACFAAGYGPGHRCVARGARDEKNGCYHLIRPRATCASIWLSDAFLWHRQLNQSTTIKPASCIAGLRHCCCAPGSMHATQVEAAQRKGELFTSAEQEEDSEHPRPATSACPLCRTRGRMSGSNTLTGGQSDDVEGYLQYE